jgi:hypothetical protein
MPVPRPAPLPLGSLLIPDGLDLGGDLLSPVAAAEGLITGTMVKMFTIAGPVIVSGTVASAVYGLVLVLLGYEG